MTGPLAAVVLGTLHVVVEIACSVIVLCAVAAALTVTRELVMPRRPVEVLPEVNHGTQALHGFRADALRYAGCDETGGDLDG